MSLLKHWFNLFGAKDRGSQAQLQAREHHTHGAGAPLEPLLMDVATPFYTWLLNIDSLTEAEPSPSEHRVLTALTQIIEAPELTSNLVPRVPAVIPKLMQSLNQPNISGKKLAQQIEQDPVLVGEVIRLANSPYYQTTAAVTSIEGAVAMLGHNGLRQLIATAVFYPIINLRSGNVTTISGPRLWSHSEKLALFCRCLAKAHDTEPFSSYLAGLVSNVGMLVGLRLMDQIYTAAGPSQSALFQTLFESHTRRLTHRIVREWEFPEVVTNAVAEQASGEFSEAMSLLGKILYLGAQLSKMRVLVDAHRMQEDPEILPKAGAPCYFELANFEKGALGG